LQAGSRSWVVNAVHARASGCKGQDCWVKVLGLQDHLVLKGESLISFPGEVSGPSCQRVWLAPCFAWAVGDLEVESGEEFRPPGLAAVEKLGGHEILEVLMICQYLDWEWG